MSLTRRVLVLLTLHLTAAQGQQYTSSNYCEADIGGSCSAMSCCAGLYCDTYYMPDRCVACPSGKTTEEGTEYDNPSNPCTWGSDPCGCNGGEGWHSGNERCQAGYPTSQDEANSCSGTVYNPSCARFTSCGNCITGTGTYTTGTYDCDWCDSTNTCDSTRCSGRYVLHGGSCSAPTTLQETAQDTIQDSVDTLQDAYDDAQDTIGDAQETLQDTIEDPVSALCDDSRDACSGLSMGTTTDCSVKAWAPHLESLAMDAQTPNPLTLRLPPKLSPDIYDEDPWVETPSCKDGVGLKYDSILSQQVREAAICGLSFAAGTDVCVPSGDQICDAVCSLGCGQQYMDPSGYVLAAEVECSSPVVVILVIVVVLMIIGGGIAGAIQYTKKGKAYKSAPPTTVVVSQAPPQPQPMQAQQAVLVQQPGAADEGP